MEFHARNQSIAEVRSANTKLTWVLVAMALALLLAMIKLFLQSEIIINQTPGMPEHAVIERSTMDKGAQKATLSAVTSTIAQINPANAEYQKAFLQSFLAPAAYTKVSRDIDDRVAHMTEQRELGSFYFILKGYEYDPMLNRHFVWGDVHTVNAARDSAAAFTFEYVVHVENYRLVVDDVATYPGERPHDSEWIKAHKS